MNPERRHITVSAATPFERGRERGEQLRDVLPGGLGIYSELFRLAGLTEDRVREDALRTADAVGAFRPRLREEMDGVAAGAGIDPWRISALNARTEILAQSGTGRPGECSTIVRRLEAGAGGPRTFGVQTWDWHVELAPYWHTHEVRGGRYDVAGVTEHGILGKVGVNGAGLALHFNILGHRADGAGGVPVHLLAATVLEEAGSVAEALDLVRSAPVSASSSFTLFDREAAVTADITPVGVFVVEPVGGSVIRTNHFLSPVPRAGEKNELYQPDSGERYDLVASRLARGPEPRSATELLGLLRSEPGQPQLCCVPDMALPLGQRWATLSTIVLEPADRSMRVTEGSPLGARDRPWRVLTA
ncbi:C45 family autoproteolytic acyltransferase/hydolase [Planomonospora venezuelensis]|uniref:Isopenicillin-N N-acyltransferase-like protein n=1 Tax=Planomonospora venezuelensis TaxID=1999 RepID=A0A841CVE9_PLAVE|nr:C45 family peptidase [Planomonospora venezuelensis]MBB5961289.1 isopenicillin-N N-acyltransferase-like protein [Planomonospora venezuelensis]GIM99963.1 acyl-CoA--6-aminopenicillanic acid acyl-transferase [Planomonospora venezuelensis]